MTEQTSESEPQQRISSVDKSFSIVEAVEAIPSPTLTNIAEYTEIPLSTTHIYLKTLVDNGYLSKENDQYQASLRFLRLGSAARRDCKVYQVAKKTIADLANETNEVAALGVEREGQRVLLYKSESSQAIYDDAPIGEYTRMHWTALGKAILAHQPDDQVANIVDTHGLPKATKYTITTEPELNDELETAANQGYAVEDEERKEGIMSVATPIEIDDQQTPIGAISVTGPKTRIQAGLEDRILDPLISKKNIIEVRYVHSKRQ